MCRSVLNSPARRILRLSSRICLFVGAAALGACAVFLAEGRLYQDSHGKLFQSSREALSTPAPLVCHARVPNVGESVGRMKIPHLGLSVVILEGDGPSVLRLGVGHIPDTSRFGETGNVGIAGHRDTFFRPLRNIRVGDLIFVITDAGSYTYRVESLRVVSPSDVGVLSTTSRPILTLVTCYPFHYIGDAPSRFVVQAGQIASSSNPALDSCPRLTRHE